LPSRSLRYPHHVGVRRTIERPDADERSGERRSDDSSAAHLHLPSIAPLGVSTAAGNGTSWMPSQQRSRLPGVTDQHQIIRRATISDGAALADLRWTWRVTEHDERGMDRTAFSASFVAWMNQHKESHAAFIAEQSEVSVGMAWLATVVRIPGPENWMRAAGHVQSVYVLPSHRKMGIGGLLVDAVISEAARSGLDYVSVHPSAMSFSLYERAGFEQSAGVLELDLRPRRQPGAP
jgi:GNAT superfamily N-acetyltransferase